MGSTGAATTSSALVIWEGLKLGFCVMCHLATFMLGKNRKHEFCVHVALDLVSKFVHLYTA